MYVYPYGDSQQLNLDWIINKLKELEDRDVSAADLEQIANVFIALTHSSGTQYRRYDYCYYQDKLYRALNDNIGAFNASDWMEVRLGDDIPVLTRLINAIDAAAVVDVKFDTSGTNGKLQQKYNNAYHDVVEVDYTPVQNSKRPLSSNAGYELNGALNTSNLHEVIHVGASREYTKFYDALDYAVAKGHVDIYVDAGEYDVITELGGESAVQALGYGKIIGNDVNVYFAEGAKLVCNYTGSIYGIQMNFSPLNAVQTDGENGDFELHNVVIEASRVRYCVHDEASGKCTYKHVYENCIMTLDNRANQNSGYNQNACIGGGFGKYATVIINGGIYETVGQELSATGTDGVIRFHQPTDANAPNGYKNTLICDNVYCKTGTIVYADVGTYTAQKSNFIAIGCKCEKLPYIYGSGTDPNAYIANIESLPENISYTEGADFITGSSLDCVKDGNVCYVSYNAANNALTVGSSRWYVFGRVESKAVPRNSRFLNCLYVVNNVNKSKLALITNNGNVQVWFDPGADGATIDNITITDMYMI